MSDELTIAVATRMRLGPCAWQRGESISELEILIRQSLHSIRRVHG